MPGFYGMRSVLSDLRKHFRTGDVAAGTLRVRGTADAFTNVAWANVYVDPDVESTALGSGGIQPQKADLYLWQLGESSTPRPDDLFIDADGRTWLLTSVKSRLDVDPGFAVFDCMGATRVA